MGVHTLTKGWKGFSPGHAPVIGAGVSAGGGFFPLWQDHICQQFRGDRMSMSSPISWRGTGGGDLQGSTS